MTSVKYNLLFTIELLHKFFTNALCTDFIIQPSVQTAALLKGYKIVAKQYDNMLYAGIAGDEIGNPVSVPAESVQFAFFLVPNPVFYNYTNLPSASTPNSIYYFTNRNNTLSNGKSFLSKAAPFDNTRTYKPGDIAANAGGTVFRAIRTSNNVTPVAGNDWMEVDANRYLSDKDILPLLSSRSVYTFATPQASATIEVRGFYPATPEDYSSLILSKTIPFINNLTSFTLDLQFLPPGKYKVKVNSDAERIVYINDELQTAQAFAVIDLYNESSLPDGYRMLDGSTLRSPLYSLYFLNRATIWKYALMSASGTITDNAGIYHFSAPAPHSVSSLSPIPLSEKALSLKLAVGAQEYEPIACASPLRLGKKVNIATDVYDSSEIFLNY